MRDESNRYEGTNFTAEKVVGALYVFMFVVIVGMGAHAQLERMTAGAKTFAAVQTTTK